MTPSSEIAGPGRVISIALSDDEWRAFTQVQPEPVSWLKSRILETIASARGVGAADASPTIGRA